MQIVHRRNPHSALFSRGPRPTVDSIIMEELSTTGSTRVHPGGGRSGSACSAAQPGEVKTKGGQNMKTRRITYALAAALTVINGTQAQSRAGNAQRQTQIRLMVSNFNDRTE
jgi:hypothetical protein